MAAMKFSNFVIHEIIESVEKISSIHSLKSFLNSKHLKKLYSYWEAIDSLKKFRLNA